MHLYIKKKTGTAAFAPSPRTLALLNSKGTLRGKSVEFDVEIPEPSCGLSPTEINALRQAHGTSTPNKERAKEVKDLMLKSYTRPQIVRIMSQKGRGYQSRTIAADHAALSKCL